MIPYFLALIISCLILFYAGKLLIVGLEQVARVLGWREFVVSFFIMAFAASIPNLSVGISSGLRGIPELSFGDVMGGSVINLTIAVALAVLFTKNHKLSAKSKTVQTTSLFTISIAILPLILILDNNLDRRDGLILIAAFVCYLIWLFSDKERFCRTFEGKNLSENNKNKMILKSLGEIILGVTLLILASETIIRSALALAEELNLSLGIIGILLVGLGNAIPETYFAISSARAGDAWMVLGNLMGSTIMLATLVLGIVVLIHPIEMIDFSPFVVARIFLIISSLFFLYCVRSDKEITGKEAVFLFILYLLFVASEICLNSL